MKPLAKVYGKYYAQIRPTNRNWKMVYSSPVSLCEGENRIRGLDVKVSLDPSYAIACTGKLPGNLLISLQGIDGRTHSLLGFDPAGSGSAAASRGEVRCRCSAAMGSPPAGHRNHVPFASRVCRGSKRAGAGFALRTHGYPIAAAINDFLHRAVLVEFIKEVQSLSQAVGRGHHLRHGAARGLA
jgi:hypothetical protein